jgi:hypothetical protein
MHIRPHAAGMLGWLFILVTSLTVVACSTSPATEVGALTADAEASIVAAEVGTPVPEGTMGPASGVAFVPDDAWTYLLERTPFPFTRDLPPDEPTILDGVYAKLEPIQGTPVPCRRCAPYRLEGGVWVLGLTNGVFRIYHELWIMRYYGSYSVEGDQIEFYNDPTCADGVGVYRWELAEDGALILDEVDDPCPMGTRVRNLTHMPWRSCAPPNEEAGISGHWNVPPGCS